MNPKEKTTEIAAMIFAARCATLSPRELTDEIAKIHADGSIKLATIFTAAAENAGISAETGAVPKGGIDILSNATPFAAKKIGASALSRRGNKGGSGKADVLPDVIGSPRTD
jgi:hypothetical protein